MTNYEAGLAAGRAEGAQAVLAMNKRLSDVTADRDEWKQQHENLLAMYRTQGEELAKLRGSGQETAPALPHLDTCGLKNGGSKCTCGLSPESSGIKIGDRVRVALNVHSEIPAEGWTVYRLPDAQWRNYGLKHDNGGDMSINVEYVAPL